MTSTFAIYQNMRLLKEIITEMVENLIKLIKLLYSLCYCFLIFLIPPSLSFFLQIRRVYRKRILQNPSRTKSNNYYPSVPKKLGFELKKKFKKKINYKYLYKAKNQNIKRMATRITFTREVSVSVKSSYTNLQPICHSPDGFFHEELMTREAPTK